MDGVGARPRVHSCIPLRRVICSYFYLCINVSAFSDRRTERTGPSPRQPRIQPSPYARYRSKNLQPYGTRTLTIHRMHAANGTSRTRYCLIRQSYLRLSEIAMAPRSARRAWAPSCGSAYPHPASAPHASSACSTARCRSPRTSSSRPANRCGTSATSPPPPWTLRVRPRSAPRAPAP